MSLEERRCVDAVVVGSYVLSRVDVSGLGELLLEA